MEICRGNSKTAANNNDEKRKKWFYFLVDSLTIHLKIRMKTVERHGTRHVPKRFVGQSSDGKKTLITRMLKSAIEENGEIVPTEYSATAITMKTEIAKKIRLKMSSTRDL